MQQTQLRRNTRQRQMVLEAVRSRCDHPTAEDIYLETRARDPKISRATVYRNLHLLADSGDIRSVRTPGGERFDLRREDHGHLLCRSCGAVADVPLPYQRALDRNASARSGWLVSSHETLFDGLCPRCRAAADADSEA